MANSATRKKMVIKGVGRAFGRRPDTGEIVDMGTLTGLKFDFSTQLDDLYGGDALFPFDQILKEKQVNVTATEAQFDLNMLSLAMGGAITDLGSGNGGYIWQLGELHTVAGGAVSLSSVASDIVDWVASEMDSDKVAYSATNNTSKNNFVVMVKSTNKILSPIAYTGTPTNAQYKLQAGSSDVREIATITVTAKPTVAGIATVKIDGVDYYIDFAGNEADVTATAVKIYDELVMIPSLNVSKNAGVVTISYKDYGNKPDVTFVDTEGTLATATIATSTQGTATGITLTVHADLNAMDLIVHYKKKSDVTSYDIKVDDLPMPLNIIQKGEFQQKDGKKQGLQIELYRVLASGTFNIDMTRRQASSHEMTLKLLDPERPDGKVGDIKRYEV